MQVTLFEWIVTLGVTVAILLFDVVVIGRRPHEPTMRECAIALSIYVGLAVLFAVGTLTTAVSFLLIAVTLLLVFRTQRRRGLMRAG